MDFDSQLGVSAASKLNRTTQPARIPASQVAGILGIPARRESCDENDFFKKSVTTSGMNRMGNVGQ